jgi:vanillate O-demethylase ferredoxin subunit|tara:strand:+ start:110 stop:1054 length:945 start_codon:yes stop_codon:yes gene_type:complete
MMDVLIINKHIEADDIVSFELTSTNHSSLPDASPGSHIDVKISDGIVRQYSVYNDSKQSNSYKIAVLKDPSSRGGSLTMHDRLNKGDIVSISKPRNLFELNDESPSYMLIAGGIGITPILSMAEHLQAKDKQFSLHYFSRALERTAFYDHITNSRFVDKSVFYFDGGKTVSFQKALLDAGDQTHLYVCGPNGFMDFVFSAAKKVGWSEERLHKEHFSAAPIENNSNLAFEVEIASTGAHFHIPEDRSVFEVLDEAGIDINVSCEQGICGSCLTKVISGIPDHRDQFLSDKEHADNNVFTPCCSRSLSDTLVLDL